MLKNAFHHPGGRRGLLWRCLLWVLCAAAVSMAQAQYSANVDFKTTYQKFEGWGTSLAWWANVVGGYPDANRNDYLNKVFDPTNGLGLNIVRYNIGGGENPKYLAPNKQFLQYRANMPGFLSSATAQYDWTQDANQRWVLQQSIQKGVTVAEAFSNSPPWWMTNSGSVTGAQDGGNNLNPTYSSQFADYLTSVVQHYHDAWGITFRTVEPFNEATSNWWKFGGVSGGSTQEGCGFDAGTQNTFVKTLGASLASKNMSYTTVSASDENGIDGAVRTLTAMDAGALGYMGQINTHTYYGSDTDRATLMADAANDGKRLWVSEYGDGDASGMTMAGQIVSDLKGMQPKSWVYWQAVDNAGGWGLMKNGLDGSTDYSYTLNEKYYVMGNFSKFIRPGYQFIGMDDANSVAAYDGNGTFVIVTVNNTSNDQLVTYNVQNMPAAMGSGPWNVQAYRTSAKENLAAQSPFYISGGTFFYNIPAGSVTTFVITPVTTDEYVAPNSAGIVDGGQYVIYTQWNYQNTPIDGNVQVLQETNRVSGQAQEAPGVQLVTDGNWCHKAITDCANIDHARVWVAHAAGDKWVFTNLHSEDKGTPLAMEITGATDGSKVIQNPRTDGQLQLWTVQPTSDGSGSYRLNPATSNLSVHMDKDNGWWGGGVYLCTESDASCNDGWSARYEWHLVPYQGSVMSTSVSLNYPAAVTTATNLKLTAKVNTNGGNTPNGTVTFYDGTTELGQSTLSGTSNSVSYVAGNLAAGTHNISAVYSGDSGDLSSAAEASINVSPLMPSYTTLASSAATIAAGQSVTFTATIATTNGQTPTGTVTFNAGSTALGSVPVTSNVVTFTTSSLAAGAYSVTAAYSGDSADAASSSSAVLVTVTAAGINASGITLNSSPAAPIVGNSITLNATVTGKGAAPAGTVYFLDGSTVLGSANVGAGGAASVKTSTLAVGTHSLTAFYTGDANYNSSTSAVDSVQVYAVPVGDYALGSSVATLDLNGKSPAFISIVTNGGYNQPIAFSCSGLPAGYSCAFSPATITPNGNGVQTTQMSVVNKNTAMLEHSSAGRGMMALAGLCCLGLPFCWRSRRKLLGTLCILILSGCIGAAISGCGSTTHVNYTVTVTGTSLPVAHTVTLTVHN